MNLETIQKFLPSTEIVDLVGITNACGSADFIEKVDAYYSDVVPGLIDFMTIGCYKDSLTIRMVIPIQEKKKKLAGYYSSPLRHLGRKRIRS